MPFDDILASAFLTLILCIPLALLVIMAGLFVYIFAWGMGVPEFLSSSLGIITGILVIIVMFLTEEFSPYVPFIIIEGVLLSIILIRELRRATRAGE